MTSKIEVIEVVLGIAMSAHWFRVHHLQEEAGLVALSVMVAMDAFNARYGRGTVKLASAWPEPEQALRVWPAGWQIKQERRTPRYTTHWRELTVVWR